ncbi:LysR family glycine cleavage system transcriptional activator [Roseibium hamelinense]|uniref:LysR family glycine cleavage system transcriptional activator n=1 Tax=Roseibium hamelinense TaxID=150831 RepID=A0A562SP32_9HYPH|nr:LysR family transcriptional regulator [Roseibium hamelinense]MTI44301.1 LysR family transcriptional regulator [Roseibium hamelinense]TWI82923.1 LysR family glycine cleavage system transcriptional activator [Roseibium hamelinense]
MSKFPNLLWLRSFEAVGRHGGFTAAGEELGLTQAAISTHIRSLEAELGYVLFERSTRKVSLTEIGKAYLPAVRQAFDDLSLSTEGFFGGRGKETVTIRAPISTATLILSPEIPALLRQEPGLSIRLVSAIWAENLLESNIDIDIRLGHGRWPGCHADPLGMDHILPVASRDLCRSITAPEDLADCQKIHILGFEDHWARYFKDLGIASTSARGEITVDTTLAAIEIAASGGGVALILERVARRLADQERLAIALNHCIPLGQDHFLIEHWDTRPPRMAVERVRTWLQALFA